jgi:hypothetical protein
MFAAFREEVMTLRMSGTHCTARALRAWLFLGAALFGSVPTAAADTQLVATAPLFEQQGLSFQEHQYLAQQFSIGAGLVTSIELTFQENTGPAFNAVLQLTKRIGPLAGVTDVLAAVALQVPIGTAPAVVSVPLNLHLASGTYYFVLSTNAPVSLNQSWILQGSPVTTGVGSAYFSQSQNLALPHASPFIAVTPPLAFKVMGTFGESACLADVSLAFSNSTLFLNFSIGATEPATWSTFLVSHYGVSRLWSVPIPAINPPAVFVVPIGPGIPSVGQIGVLTMLSTDTAGILCAAWKTVNTNPQ